MKKYIIELDELLKNRLMDADTQLVSNDLSILINALDGSEEFDEKDYLSIISLEKLEKEIKTRKDLEMTKIKNRLWYLDQEKSKISDEMKILNDKLEETQPNDN